MAYLRDKSTTFGAMLYVIGLGAALPGTAPAIVTLVAAVRLMANLLIALAAVDGLLDAVTSPAAQIPPD